MTDDAPFVTGEAVLPRILVVGHGHAGGAVAEVAAEAGCEVEIWGRRPVDELTPALRRLVLDRFDAVRYRAVDVHQVVDLSHAFAPFDWVVLANEPRPQEASEADISEISAQFTEIYRAARRAGFTVEEGRSPLPRCIVRIGSPPAERPAVSAVSSPYFAVKQQLEGLAAAQASMGTAVLTVAPTEIHSPFSSYGASDPYRLGLDRLGAMLVIHDVTSAAVSDRSLGEAVLRAAAGGEVGGWYQVSDAGLGPGSVLATMARHLGRRPPPVASWDATGAEHLLAVLDGQARLDLHLLASHTTGLEPYLDAAIAVRSTQNLMTRIGLWWAGPAVTERADRATDEMNARLESELLRSGTGPLGPRMLAIILAMGADRRDPALDALPPWRELDAPGDAERSERLAAAVARQAEWLVDPRTRLGA